MIVFKFTHFKALLVILKNISFFTLSFPMVSPTYNSVGYISQVENGYYPFLVFGLRSFIVIKKQVWYFSSFPFSIHVIPTTLNTNEQNIVDCDKGKNPIILLGVTYQTENAIEEQMQMAD